MTMAKPMAWMGLTLGLALATPTLASPDYSGGVSGAEVQRLVTAALRSAGQPADGVAAPLRAYPACTTTPDVTPHQGDWSTVDLTCAAPHWVRALRLQTATGGWTRKDAPAADVTTRPAVVLTHPLPKGTTLQASDLILADVAGLGSDTVYSDPVLLIGRVLKTNLAAGKSLQPRHLAPDYLVRKDGPVAITAQSGGIAVGMAGLALEDGEAGDVVLVRNLSSNREMRAVVAGPQIVTVQPNIN
jgi:flagella basal body P-ring formation protein FlgA